MTDMRATERLLEYIQEKIGDLESMRAEYGTPDQNIAADIGEEMRPVIAELRRRGDTLVRRDDLERVLRHAVGDDHWPDHDPYERFVEARSRLENAIGGKP